MIRQQAKKGHFMEERFWFSIRYRFVAGDLHSSTTWSKGQFRNLSKQQNAEPVLVLHDIASSTRWWWFNDRFYTESEGLLPVEVKALILEKQRKKEARVRRAIAWMEHEPTIGEATRRTSISDKIKIFVWQRDNGKCVKCGSQHNLEFDHDIPISMGGSNSARNLQLLCESCNRAKGGSLV
jgi:hypothetical protein